MMPDLTLRGAAEYVRTSRAPRAFLSFLNLVRRVYSFTQERSNRLSRYVVITRAYKAGAPVREIESRFGCTTSTVLRYARMAELPKRPKHFPAEIRAAVIHDYKDGLSVADIAKLHDVSAAYVSKTAREAGISRYEPRPKRGRR